MVRAGAVHHPSEYGSCGYNEIQNPPKRYRIIDSEMLLNYFSIHDETHFRQEHYNWVEIELKNNALARNSRWSESIAVGSKPFISEIQQKLASLAQKRSAVSSNGVTVRKEPQQSYGTVFEDAKGALSNGNSYVWEVN